MSSLWGALKDKIRERADWNTFKTEIGQGLDLMPQAGVVLPGKVPASILVKNLMKARMEGIPSGHWDQLKGFIDPDNFKIYRDAYRESRSHNSIASLLGFDYKHLPKRLQGSTEQSSELAAKLSGLIRYLAFRGTNRLGNISSTYMMEGVNKPKVIKAMDKLLEKLLSPQDTLNIDLFDPWSLKYDLSSGIKAIDWYPGYIQDALKKW